MKNLPTAPDPLELRTEELLAANATLVTAAFIGVNLVLKLPLISSQGLWFDEAVSLSQVQGSYDLTKSLTSDASAPLFGLLLYGWSALFGPTLEAARSLSAIFSACTAGALFLFGRRFLSARTGLFAALLFTLSRTQLYYGHEARAYALVGLLCVASFYVFLELLEDPKWSRAALAGVLSAALVYAHYVAVFALVAQLVAALWLVHIRSRAMMVYVSSQLFAGVLFAPCAAFLLLSDSALPMRGWIPTPSPGDVLYVLSAFAGGPLLVGLYAAVLGATIGFVQIGSIRLDRNRVVVLLLWLILPLVLDYGVSFVMPSFLYRYLLYASLALFLLTAYAISRLPVPEAGRWGALALILLPAAWGTAFDPILRSDWRGAAEIAQTERTDGVLTIITPPYQLLPFAYHYAPDAFARQETMVESLGALGVHALPTLTGVPNAVRDRSNRVVILSEAGQLPTNFTAAMAAAGYDVVRSQDLTGVQVRVFRSER